MKDTTTKTEVSTETKTAPALPTKREINATNKAYDSALSGTVTMIEKYSSLGDKLSALKTKVTEAKAKTFVVDETQVDSNGEYKKKMFTITWRDWCEGNDKKGLEGNLHFSWKMAEKYIQLFNNIDAIRDENGNLQVTSLNDALKQIAQANGTAGSRGGDEEGEGEEGEGKAGKTPVEKLLQQIENVNKAFEKCSVDELNSKEVVEALKAMGWKYDGIVKGEEKAA